MRDLKDFTKAEWIRRQPLQYGFKQVRNDVMQNVILRRRPKTLEKFLEANAHLKAGTSRRSWRSGSRGCWTFF